MEGPREAQVSFGRASGTGERICPACIALHASPTPLTPLRAQALEEQGLFRATWCMPWEAFLKIMKKMFRMSNNWQDAPYRVAVHWSVKSVMHYRDPARASWFDNEVVPSSEFSTSSDEIAKIAKTSQLITVLLSVRDERPSSSRFLRCVLRGRREVRQGDWVLLEERGQQPRVGRIDQMAQVGKQWTADGQSVIRMWCVQCRTVYSGSLRAEQCECLATLTSEPCVSVLVRFECMSVTPVTRVSGIDGACTLYV